MKTDDVPALKTDSTSGLGSASQVISLTSLPLVSGRTNTTAVMPRQLVRVRLVAGIQNKPAMKEPPRLRAEARWKRLATQERKKVRARGSRPSER